MEKSGAGESLKRRRVVIQCVTKFEGRELVLPSLSEDDSVEDLKSLLEEATSVPCKRMRLVGLVKGKLPGDDVRLGTLPSKGLRRCSSAGDDGKKRLNRENATAGAVGTRVSSVSEDDEDEDHTAYEEDDDDEEVRELRFTMMGTPDAKLLMEPSAARKASEELAARRFAETWHEREENRSALEAMAARTEINWIAPPRPGKKLLVLDLDHTLVDFNHRRSSDAVARRPHLDAFLEAVYPHYDIAVWSQTSWRWIELKTTELGMLLASNYKICFVLDKKAMLSVACANRRGVLVERGAKPLHLVWRLCPQWTAANTVHVDDLARNFVLNPRNGLRCKPFHRDDPKAADDCELPLLACYLVNVLARQDTFIDLDHSSWRTSALAIYKTTRERENDEVSVSVHVQSGSGGLAVGSPGSPGVVAGLPVLRRAGPGLALPLSLARPTPPPLARPGGPRPGHVLGRVLGRVESADEPPTPEPSDVSRPTGAPENPADRAAAGCGGSSATAGGGQPQDRDTDDTTPAS